MVEDPADYRWSSYRANGFGQTDLKLSTHPVTSKSPTTPANARPAIASCATPRLTEKPWPTCGSRSIKACRLATAAFTPKSHRPSENDAKLGHAGDHAAMAKTLRMQDNNNRLYWRTRLVAKVQQDKGAVPSLRFGSVVSFVA
ncbi:MAG: hypothetical protein AW10_02564 [Candidatus Accumulibacter appositus]|uniref:Uncharacterized protein n=1 Tax=Candidatus Accumulibacter appositus TaxID=1454003 RepID=A0A011N969_9PROT|nr:MAG: hypothetical protein AW10_02564 [Candidatus Accumulibacter appositus]